MPDSLEAAIVFALLIVPGYAYLAGYRLGRDHAAPRHDLYVVAQAVVVSVLVLAPAWFWVQDLFSWIEQDALGDHAGQALTMLLVLILGPFAAGRGAAGLLERMAGRAAGARLLDLLRLIPQGNAWQTAWASAHEHGALVVIDLKDGGTIYGQMTRDGSVDLPPHPPALYLPVAYRPQDGQLVPMRHGAYVHGDQIAALYLKERPEPAESQ